ncbi:MAG: hypothetical protein HUJ75_06725 [Parasporobacterium sp.]|nr:hypothetical protein [Parasporobacterium sp.]
MKKFLAILLAALMVVSLAACGGGSGTSAPAADGATGAAQAEPVKQGTGTPTIIWLSNLTAGAQYEGCVNYLTAICDALGYKFTVVYGDSFNDAAGNLNAIKNAMTTDVKGIIVSQDGGLAAIMEEYPDLYIAGYNTEIRSAFDPSGENAAVLSNDHFLGTISDGYTHGEDIGHQYAQEVINRGLKKVAVINFPGFAYPSLIEGTEAFYADIEEYNKTAAEKIEVVGEATTLMFSPLEDSWFLETGYGDLDAIVGLCAGVQFIYPTLVSAKAGGSCDPKTILITSGFDTDPNIVADIGEGRNIAYVSVSPLEDCAYSLVLLDNAISGNMPADFQVQQLDGNTYIIDSIEDIDNVMSKSLMGTTDVALAQIPVEEIVAACGRNNPDFTYADLVELFHSDKLSADALK